MTSKPWLESYPECIPHSVDIHDYKTLISFFAEKFKAYATLPAFTSMGQTISFAELDLMSTQFGAFLHGRGLGPGDKIALMMPNLLQYPIAFFGAMKAGLIVVNTNPLYTKREMLHQFEDAEVKAIVIAENFASNLQEILPKTSIELTIVTSIGETLSFPKSVITNFVIRRIKKLVPKYDLPDPISFKTALSQGAKSSIKPFRGQPEDTILIQYTGGTTGVAKGAMLTNASVMANLIQLKAFVEPYLKEREEIVLTPLPLYHALALAANGLMLASLGAHNILIVNPRDISSLIKEFKSHKISAMVGVNTLYIGLLNHPEFKQLDFSNMRMAASGGMAVQEATAQQWYEVTNCPMIEGYGMTECSPFVSLNPLDGSGKLGSVGLPIPETEVRIVDDNLNPLAIGETGEIQIRGPQLMKGYYNRPDETNKIIVDGWLCSGDIGVMDKDGYFKIVDRKKDMILVSGFNVYPNEIEDVIAFHPKVLEVAAVAHPDEKSTEVVKVFVVKKDETLTAEELSAYCKRELTAYKRPKYIEFREELPKSTVGKILKKELRVPA